MIFGFRASKYGPQNRGQGSKLRGCVLCRCLPQIGTPWQICIISPSIFRQPDKKKGTVSKSQCLRLSKNYRFSSSLSLETTLSSEYWRKTAPWRAHFFFPCINSEIHAPGIYEFAKQIRLNACCRTKHKNRILLFRQAEALSLINKDGAFLWWQFGESTCNFRKMWYHNRCDIVFNST